MPLGATSSDGGAHPDAAAKSRWRRRPAWARPAVDSACPCPGNRETSSCVAASARWPSGRRGPRRRRSNRGPGWHHDRSRIRKGLAQLRHRPIGRRVWRDVEGQDPAAAVVDHKAVQQPEGRRRHGEEVQDDDGLAAVAKKRKPPFSGSPRRRIRRQYRAMVLSETAKPSF